VKITFLGAVQSVTGSMHILESNGSRVLLDCGMFQGRREESNKKNRNLPFDPLSLNAMILSHAHIDHCGNIPTLTRNGYEGPIYATRATKDLCQYMLADSGHIQEKDAEYLNQRRLRRGDLPIMPLYTQQDALDAMYYFMGKNYEHKFSVCDNFQATFFDAGHILGSALTKISIKENGSDLNIGYIVDLGRKNLPLLRDPVVIQDLDYIIIESTYGGRFHDDIQTASEKLRQVIQRTFDRGGKVIIPSFALERTQEIVYQLNNLWNAGRLPRIPVFVDSPLAVNVTKIFNNHKDCFDDETIEVMTHDDDPFGFKGLSYIHDVEESKKINSMKEPCIVISASGMCETGRILHHLKNNIESSKNTVLIVGFMAQNTLGRKLVEKMPHVKIFGMEYSVRAEIVKLNAFSAHADRGELLNYVQQANQKLKGVFLVHGEQSQINEFQNGLKGQGIENVHIPSPGEIVEL
jgi:metallo-beta-lactamase family protein